jgi:hypothetical protein
MCSYIALYSDVILANIHIGVSFPRYGSSAWFRLRNDELLTFVGILTSKEYTISLAEQNSEFTYHACKVV